MTGIRPLRPHQVRALDLLRASLLAGHRRPMLAMPTGSGKTRVAAEIVHGARRKGNRVVFCVPSLSLVDQTAERFAADGIDPGEIGVIQGNHHWRRPHAPIQIATAQTLARRERPQADVVVVDEAHVRFDVYERWMAEDPRRVFIGLSATPWSRGLGRLYDDLIRPTSIRELIEAGYLSKFRVFAPAHPDLAGVKTVAGDYHEGQLAERMNQPTLVADIVSTWLTMAQGLPTLCFATGRLHAQALHERFASVGVSAAYVDADTPREERERIGRRLAAGDVQVVVNIGCLTTGIDWDVRCLILARPTKSESLFVQIVGRALRTAEGKEDALILDHSDTHLRLGMVTDIDYDTLDDGRKDAKSEKKREKRIPLPKECPECACLIPAGTRECPSCGHEIKRRIIEETHGELVELGGRRGSKAPSATEAIKALGKESVYAQLNWIAMERGRSPGWVAHTYRDIFGVWPRGQRGLREPSALVLSFVRSKDIRWAKRRKAEGESHAAH